MITAIPLNVSPELGAVLNHVWQSTLFVAAAGALTLALRNHHARVRYWLWLAASAKFVVPFVALSALGRGLAQSFGWLHPIAVRPNPNLQVLVNQVSHPFSAPAAPVSFTPHAHATGVPLALLVAVWGLGAAVVALNWWLRARRVKRALRAAEPLPLHAGLPVMSSPGQFEPGVFGILRPVLLLPHGITDHLTAAELAAVVAHESCHVRRRDNLAAAFHMCVEAVFWFHPLVWWIGKQLLTERERACDEEVVRLGSEPEVYAQGILNVCKLYLESPLDCVSGVTGANLKTRIEDIMTRPNIRELTLVRKVLLSAAALAAVCGPIAIGLLNAPRSFGQTNTSQYTFGMQTSAGKTFEVASVKPGPPGEDGWQLGPPEHGGISILNLHLRKIIASSFRIQDSMVVGPDWLDSARYTIVAKGADPTVGNPVVWEMMRALLAERFQLRYHIEPKERAIFALVVAKGGHKLKSPMDGPCAEAIKRNEHCANLRFSPMNIGITNMPVGAIIGGLGRIMQDRPIVDKTGLSGDFDMDVNWVSEGGLPGRVPVAGTPGSLDVGAMLTALEEQAGLKIESQKGPVDFLVIDRVEKPSAN
jgi:bla regulator protein BlaR1